MLIKSNIYHSNWNGKVKFGMIKAKGELINRNISWIMISFDNDKINILLVNKLIKKYNRIMWYWNY